LEKKEEGGEKALLGRYNFICPSERLDRTGTKKKGASQIFIHEY